MGQNVDQIFNEEISKIPDFTFSNKVANVFDDMVTRSVPYYPEMQRMIGEIAGDHFQEGSIIYDLGCSTGATLLHMDKGRECFHRGPLPYPPICRAYQLGKVDPQFI